MPGSRKSPYFPNMKEDLDNIATAPPNNIGPCNIRRDFRCLNINAASPGYLAAAADGSKITIEGHRWWGAHQW